VVQRGGADFVKVRDVGIAKLRDGGDDQAATMSGMILGTPHYMSPEQALGKPVDRTADVWAAGVVLYEVLAGAVPFTAASFVELAGRIREQPPKPLPARTPRGERIPPALAAVVMRCLEKKPADRFRSMAALAEALRERQDVRAPRRSRRRLAAAAAALGAVGVAGALAVRYDVPRQLRAGFQPAVRTVQGAAERARSAAAAAAVSATPSATATSTATPQTIPTATSSPTPAPPTVSGSPPRTPPRASVRPATVELLLRSSPAGARVVRLDTNERLGKTPLRIDVRRKASTVWLEMTLDGWQPVRFAVDLSKDNTANVEFRNPSRKTPHRH
jgi:serine/threonine-protein kinase